jgi:hypothetical protein
VVDAKKEIRLSRRKGRKSQQKTSKNVRRGKHVPPVIKAETADLAKRERYFEVFVIAALFGFGVYQSVLYFGHTIVPNSDFPAFFKTGQELLSFQTPSSFKRVPVLGLLQVLLSYVVGGQHPGLTAGWLLNAIFHPFNLVLLWLIGREIVGKSAVWLAIIAILNPWVIYLLTEPIVETTLLFFALLTFYLMFKRSKWCYLLASITTMVRYEGAALVLTAFVMDMIHGKDKRERIWAFLYSALAAVPLAIWMLWTALSWEGGGSHYLSVLFTKEYAKGFAQPVANRTGLVLHMRLLWRVGFQPLLKAYPGASSDFSGMLEKLSKFLVIAGFSFGSIYGLFKRQWRIGALMIFFVLYFIIHARYPYPILRFHASIFWIVQLIGWFGFQSMWRLIDKNKRVPRRLLLILQVLGGIIAIIWFIRLVPGLSGASRMSPTSASLPYVAMALVGLFFVGRISIYKARYLPRELLVLVLLCLIIVSNQFTVAGLVGDGQKNREFKMLAEWYVANAKPDEKLAVYMVAIVRLFAPKHEQYIAGFPKADSPTDLVKSLYENDITYVVWATREGIRGGHTGYKTLGLDKNIALLREPKDTGPYEFVRQVGWERGWVNIFRLRKPAEMSRHELPSH